MPNKIAKDEHVEPSRQNLKSASEAKHPKANSRSETYPRAAESYD